MFVKYLFDVTEEGHPPHSPVPGSNIALKVNRPDVIHISPRWLSIDRTLVQSGKKYGRNMATNMTQAQPTWRPCRQWC